MTAAPTTQKGQEARLLSTASLPTRYGPLTISAFHVGDDSTEHVALWKGAITEGIVPVFVHAECLMGQTLGSRLCACGQRLDDALQRLAASEVGIIVYLRPHPLAMAVARSLDHADERLDARSRARAAAILRALGIIAYRFVDEP